MRVISIQIIRLLTQSLFSLIALVLLSGLPLAAQAAAPAEKVRLQLKWFHQFQFAGYYAAVEQGYYADEGLAVEIIERDLNKSVVKQVTAGEAEYGVGDSGMLSQYAQGEPVVALAAIFQHNPLVYFALQNSGIISPYEMLGKRVMSDTLSANEAPLKAMLAAAGVSDKDYTLLKQSNDYSLLVQGQLDVISGYLTDQSFYFKQQGVKVNVINPQNYGIDFYGDFLFTSQDELKRHPQRVERFLRASLKGWRYALDHSDELIKIIHQKYHSKLSLEHLRYESEETRKLILPDVIPIGQMDVNRLKVIATTFALSGFNKPLTDAQLSAFVYAPHAPEIQLTEEERNWLDGHPTLYVGVDRDFAPYEWVDSRGHYVGMVADYLKLLEKKLGVHFQIVGDKSWDETLALAKAGKLDMLSAAAPTPERSKYLTFIKPYKSAPVVIIDNGGGNFIGGLDRLKGKRVAIEKGYFMEELLRAQHPELHIVQAQNTKEALNLVADGKVDAYVGDAGTANYLIKKEGLVGLRFSGQTQYASQQSIAVSKNNPLLVSILSKAMSAIPQNEADEIFNRWLGLKIEQGVKHETLLKYAALALAVLLLFLWWIARLRKEIETRKRVEIELLARSAAIEQSPISIVITDLEGNLEYVNPMFSQVTGYSPDEAVGRNPRMLQSGLTPEERYVDMWETLTSGRAWQGELINRRKNGEIYWEDAHIAPVKNTVGETVHYVAAKVDMTQRRKAEEAVQKSEARFRFILEHSPVAVRISKLSNGKFMFANQRYSELLGIPFEQLSQVVPKQFYVNAQEYDAVYMQLAEGRSVTNKLLELKSLDGVAGKWVLASYLQFEYDNEPAVLGWFYDISDRKSMEEQVRHLAHYDALTDLPNRILFADRVQQALTIAKREKTRLALMFMDLDKFKPVNDEYGHEAGDLLLQAVARRIQDCLRESDTVARIGGDEFVVLLPLIEFDEDALGVAEKIRYSLNQPFEVLGHTVKIGSCAGVAIYPEHGEEENILMKRADIAMYYAKADGRDNVKLYEPTMEKAATSS